MSKVIPFKPRFEPPDLRFDGKLAEFVASLTPEQAACCAQVMAWDYEFEMQPESLEKFIESFWSCWEHEQEEKRQP